MRKDGLQDKISNDLHRIYDHVVREHVPENIMARLAKLEKITRRRD